MSRVMLIAVTAFMLLMGGFGAILAGQPITRSIALGKQAVLETQVGHTERDAGAPSAPRQVTNLEHTAVVSVTLLLPATSGENFTLTVPVAFDLDVTIASGRSGTLQVLQQEIPILNVSELAEPQLSLETIADLLPTPTPDPAGGPPHVTMNVNLRRGPDIGYPVTGQARPGDTFELLARNLDGTWYQVQMADGTSGWMAAYLVRGRIEEAELEIIPGISVLIPTPTPASQRENQ